MSNKAEAIIEGGRCASSDIEAADRESAIKCPLCGQIMVPSQIECDDGSGWSVGWLCGCTPQSRENAEYPIAEIIVHRGLYTLEAKHGR